MAQGLKAKRARGGTPAGAGAPSAEAATPRAQRKAERRRVREARRHASDVPFERAALWLLARGVHPNHLTFLQLPLYVALIVCASEGWAHAFAFLNLLVPVLDGGDGILARVGKLQSKAGAVLDTTFDTLGIAIVMWGATRFFPELTLWIMLLFFGSIVLFLQNALLDRKVISYVRGPVLIAVVFPEAVLGALVVAGTVTVWLIAWRTRDTFRALGRLMPM